MKRWILNCSTECWIVAIIATMSGCSMCCGPYDFDYPTFGGKHERIDRAYGRVGSVFSDPNAQYGFPADRVIDSSPTAGEQMEPIDELRDPMESLDELENSDDPQSGPQPDNGNEATISDQRWRQRPLRRGRHWR